MADTFEIKDMESAVDLANRVKTTLNNIKPLTVDTAAIREAADLMQLIQNSATMTESDILEIQRAMSLMAQQKSIMATTPFVSVTDKKVMQSLEDILGSMVENIGAMNKALQEKAKLETGIGANQKRQASYMEKQAKSMYNYAQSATGVQLSLIGIIALIIRLKDLGDRIGAYSEQTASAWEDAEGNIAAAGTSLRSLRTNFKLSYDQAGALTTSLTRMGFERKDMLKYSQASLAVEKIYGQTVGAQGQIVKNLVGDFKELGDSEKDRKLQALDYMQAIRETVKAIPGLSMEEAIDDWSKLINMTKAYNTDLLGTLGMYNLMMDQDLAKNIGFGEIPRETRKEITEFFVGLPDKMSDGMKAKLGSLMEGGELRSMTENIFKFEGSKVEERVKAFSKFIENEVPDFMDPDGMFKVRKVLMGLGEAGQNMAVKLSEIYNSGGLTGKKLEDVIRSISDEREKAKGQQKSAAATRDALTKKGMSIAQRLVGALEELKQWMEDNLVGPVQELAAALNRVAEIFGNYGDRHMTPQERRAREFAKQQKELGSVSKQFDRAGGGKVLGKLGKQLGEEETMKKLALMGTSAGQAGYSGEGSVRKAFLADKAQWMSIFQRIDESRMKELGAAVRDLAEQYDTTKKASKKGVPKPASSFTTAGAKGV